MYIKKFYGYVVPDKILQAICKGKLDFYDPPTIKSVNWKHWVANLDVKTCLTCRKNHGKVYAIAQDPALPPPVHPHCRCIIKIMNAVYAGNATKDGHNGADWWIKNHGGLPDYYLTKTEMKFLGWRFGKPPAKFAPGKMITGEIYRNEDEHLPQTPGRIWHEADINYYSGKRNGHRILWSNDGLIFATYDHYETFSEIV